MIKQVPPIIYIRCNESVFVNDPLGAKNLLMGSCYNQDFAACVAQLWNLCVFDVIALG